MRIVIVSFLSVLFLALGCSSQADDTAQSEESVRTGQQMQSEKPQSDRSASKDSPPPAAGNFKQIEFKTIDGQSTNLAAYDGKVKLIVNVASKCGYTPQYEGLQDLYSRYKERDFVVLGFPANNFKNQEPGSNEEIKAFCTSKYGVTFPMMSKISVKGNDIHPLYAYLTANSIPPGEITWNFNKFLLDGDGDIVARWPSEVEPTSDQIGLAIEQVLKQEAQRSGSG